ncbi:uncharacterized protein TNCV_1971201 [Trichonephila clavipes]|uniref:HAT C-terminal dimerisation domain-containing protein n=1 Tax=Trichonephila clavipes TaxID=2585209 RepID=A0A8X6W5N2_TRICX|nr:uncharacterized protein TNCV_1971201 [Trichonephila clavipes]
MELLKNCKDFFKDLRSDTVFNEMLCDAREPADEIDIPANFELTQPRHRVRRRNVLFDYVARDDPIEDPTLKYKAEFYFFTLERDKSIIALESRFDLIRTHISYFQFNTIICDLKDTPQNDELKYCKDLETELTDGNSSDINVLDRVDEIAVLALLNKNESSIEILKFISNLDFAPNLGIILRILLTLPISVASGERSLSKLKLIKKFLRSATTEDRLNGLTTTAIEHELATEINVKDIKKYFRIKNEKERETLSLKFLTFSSNVFLMCN